MDLPSNQPIVAVWKPKGPSSFKMVSLIRKLTGEKKVGHAGTLDPLAEGVLVIGIGREGTKQLHDIVGHQKEYEAVIKLGEESSTDDAEGEKTKFEVSLVPSREMIGEVVDKFIGNIEQTPPPYSAMKIGGKRAYKLAREGKEVILLPRPVAIKNIEIMGYSWPILEIRVVTGPGVYIRSLARDIGRELKTGGYIASLTRTRVGEFTREQAIKLPDRESLSLEKIEENNDS
ncbi:MAG: tRNA pseudouridine(55) synthase TruB [Patescibacteria group bacterium]